MWGTHRGEGLSMWSTHREIALRYGARIMERIGSDAVGAQLCA